MKFKTLTGKTKVANINKYSIDWNAACRGKSKWGKFQYEIKQFFKEHWENHVVCEEFPCFGTAGGGLKTLRIDILNFTRGIAVEVNGIQHSEYSSFFHGDRIGFLNQIERDNRKSKWCELNDIDLIYIYPEDELGVNYLNKKFNVSI